MIHPYALRAVDDGIIDIDAALKEDRRKVVADHVRERYKGYELAEPVVECESFPAFMEGILRYLETGDTATLLSAGEVLATSMCEHVAPMIQDDLDTAVSHRAYQEREDDRGDWLYEQRRDREVEELI